MFCSNCGFKLQELSIRIKDAINITLEDLEDFGGIQEVVFTSFEIR